MTQRDMTNVALFRKPFPGLNAAQAIADKLWANHNQLCLDFLDWPDELESLNTSKLINFVLVVDISGSEQGFEEMMAEGINRVITKVGRGAFAAWTYVTVIFFNDGVFVACKMIHLLNAPIIAPAATAKPGDIVYSPKDATNLNGAIIAACCQKLAFGDYSYIIGYATRTIMVILTDAGHNHGVFDTTEARTMLEAASIQHGRFLRGMVSIGDQGIADYARKIGFGKDDVWTIDRTEEAMDGMVDRVSSLVEHYSTHVVLEESGFFNPNMDVFSEESPVWDPNGGG